MTQTAVEWLVNELKCIKSECGNQTVKIDIKGKLLKQAKEMEREQHQETFKQSRQAKIFEKDMPPIWESWEQYYNETFKSE